MVPRAISLRSSAAHLRPSTLAGFLRALRVFAVESDAVRARGSRRLALSTLRRRLGLLPCLQGGSSRPKLSGSPVRQLRGGGPRRVRALRRPGLLAAPAGRRPTVRRVRGRLSPPPAGAVALLPRGTGQRVVRAGARAVRPRGRNGGRRARCRTAHPVRLVPGHPTLARASRPRALPLRATLIDRAAAGAPHQ